ncbi:hypothetical protein ACYJA9_001913 [Campylobacter upsaliensis]|uniref:hypothetical protein n=1 Tax=Campylobacter upsaliensis TaxID=28080 RepID=UPI0012C0F027|nr:hypothetical protein [Campylobacter upsaliensis]EAK7296365.1 hypothetical protein [Campylobacter upsaliensis]ECK6872917.1 hypothetical protein [Campylobacter upsaliensis]ECK6874189.1 hypothetical protein [Campylobacter upsaliensis]ECV9711297.1 hypothetical protein [Campylobacter upsaliensis]ECV9712539.1 hypothetical protein [Campylobacter upsaliensis]
MALIEVCGKLVDTRLKFSGKPALDFAQVALEKERIRQKEEEKKAISIEYSEEYLSVKAAKATLFQNEEGVENSKTVKKEISTAQATYSKIDLKLDILI